jgi:Rod binding domain-containing protein
MGTSMIGLGGMTAQANVQQAQESQTLSQLSSMKGPTSAEKIEKGSKQFETMLLSSWLRQAEQSFATVPGADDDGDQDMAGRDQMLGLGVQSLAQAMEASGGIGIAKMIAKAMTTQAEKAEQASPAAEPAPEGQKSVGNLSFPLNSGGQSADRVAGSEKGSQ